MATHARTHTHGPVSARGRIRELVRRFEARGYDIVPGFHSEVGLILRHGLPIDFGRAPRADRPLFDDLWRLADELKWC